VSFGLLSREELSGAIEGCLSSSAAAGSLEAVATATAAFFFAPPPVLEAAASKPASTLYKPSANCPALSSKKTDNSFVISPMLFLLYTMVVMYSSITASSSPKSVLSWSVT
jgi:hypothetical protein